MFLPGQVESWDIIYDLGGMGVTEIPTGVLKSMMQKMSSNYGGRLHRLWVVNAPMTISISWKIVSAFLDKVTVDKIKISKSSSDKDMWNVCDKSQVEVKYGGTQPNRKTYWYSIINLGHSKSPREFLTKPDLSVRNNTRRDLIVVCSSTTKSTPSSRSDMRYLFDGLYVVKQIL